MKLKNNITKNMNIAFLTTEYSHTKTPVSGGIGTFFKILGEELVKRGHRVVVFVYWGKKNYTFFDGAIEVCVKKDFFKTNKYYDLKRSLTRRNDAFYKQYIDTYKKERTYIAKHFLNFIKNKHIDVIETQDYGGISLKLETKIPIVIRCHGTNTVLTQSFNYPYNPPRDKVINEMERLTIENKKNNIVTVSKYSSSLIEKYFNRFDTTVIYNGVNTNKFKKDENVVLQEKSIFYLGTLSKEKGLDVLCNTFNKVIEQYPDATLHLIGRREDYWEYLRENILSKEALRKTKYYGAVKYDVLENYLQKAFVFVFPTRGENFPFVLLEAMAMQKIVISSNIPSAYEIIKNTNNGFIAKNDDDFYNLLVTVFENSTTTNNQIALNAKNTVDLYFTYNAMVENTIEYYTKLL